jgi:hypothetical protein
MIRAFAISLSMLCASCHLYFEEEDDEAADAAPPSPSDASVDVCDRSQAETEDELRRCFEFTVWEARGLCNLPQMNTAAGTCAFCHGGGGDGIQLNADCALTFNGMSLTENFEDLQAAELDGNGCVTGFVPGKICSSQLISDTHPPFVCPNAIRRGLQEFLAAGYARVLAGDCAP